MNRHQKELTRFVINGVLATAVHYTVLVFNLSVIQLASAGIANFLAALFGITASFLGSRYYVFPQAAATFRQQLRYFGALYALIALLHAGVLFIWTDHLGWDYRIGFVLVTGLQVTMSYLGNKFLVFKA